MFQGWFGWRCVPVWFRSEPDPLKGPRAIVTPRLRRRVGIDQRSRTRRPDTHRAQVHPRSQVGPGLDAVTSVCRSREGQDPLPRWCDCDRQAKGTGRGRICWHEVGEFSGIIALQPLGIVRRKSKEIPITRNQVADRPARRIPRVQNLVVRATRRPIVNFVTRDRVSVRCPSKRHTGAPGRTQHDKQHASRDETCAN